MWRYRNEYGICITTSPKDVFKAVHRLARMGYAPAVMKGNVILMTFGDDIAVTDQVGSVRCRDMR
jgi:hypothetical protein